MSMKNSDTIGNRTRDLPACSSVPQQIITAVVTKSLLSILPSEFHSTLTAHFLW